MKVKYELDWSMFEKEMLALVDSSNNEDYLRGIYEAILSFRKWSNPT